MSITEKAHAPADLIKALEVAGVEETGTITTKQAVDVLTHMGLPVVPEKPEPGVYLASEDHIGFVDYDGDFHLLNLTGANYREPILHRDAGAYSAQLARVVPEAEWQELVKDRDQWRLAAESEAHEADELRVKVAVKNLAPAEPPVLTEDEKFGIGKDIHRAYMDERGDYRDEMLAVYEKAAELFAKHGGARELPGRDEVLKALRDSWFPTISVTYFSKQADAVMDLLGGGGRGE